MRGVVMAILIVMLPLLHLVTIVVVICGLVVVQVLASVLG